MNKILFSFLIVGLSSASLQGAVAMELENEQDSLFHPCGVKFPVDFSDLQDTSSFNFQAASPSKFGDDASFDMETIVGNRMYPQWTFPKRPRFDRNYSRPSAQITSPISLENYTFFTQRLVEKISEDDMYCSSTSTQELSPTSSDYDSDSSSDGSRESFLMTLDDIFAKKSTEVKELSLEDTLAAIAINSEDDKENIPTKCGPAKRNLRGDFDKAVNTHFPGTIEFRPLNKMKTTVRKIHNTRSKVKETAVFKPIVNIKTYNTQNKSKNNNS